MKRLSLVLGALALALLPASSAVADTFDFSFTGADFSGSGTFTATHQTGDNWLITGITGQVAGYTIDSLLAPGTYPTGTLVGPNDNILIYPAELFGTKFFDHDGVAFDVDTPIGLVNVNLNDTFGFENAAAGPGNTVISEELTSVDVDPAPTPEPDSLFLLGTGVLGIAGVLRRRIAASAAPAA